MIASLRISYVLLGLTLVLGCRPPGEPKPERQEEPKPTPHRRAANAEEMRLAWEKAGARFCRTRLGDGLFMPGKAWMPKGDEIPGFQITKWEPSVWADLPEAEEPFGLSVLNTQVTD